jgi:hypothetical protein
MRCLATRTAITRQLFRQLAARLPEQLLSTKAQFERQVAA